MALVKQIEAAVGEDEFLAALLELRELRGRFDLALNLRGPAKAQISSGWIPLIRS